MGEGRGEGTGAYGVEMRARPEARVGLEVEMGLEVREEGGGWRGEGGG